MKQWCKEIFNTKARGIFTFTYCQGVNIGAFIVLQKGMIISLYRIDWLVFITETECVYWAVRTKPLNTIKVNFRFMTGENPTINTKSNSAPYSPSPTRCSYQDKWARPGNLPKSNTLSEIDEHWIGKFFNLFKIVPWLRQLAAAISARRLGFDPGPFHVRFVVDEVSPAPNTSVFPFHQCPTHLHQHLALTRRTSGRSPEIFRKAILHRTSCSTG
jgi:hypothetical protein